MPFPDLVFRLLIALVAGSVLGLEREYRQKPAGFRTIALITLGAALFTVLSIEIGAPNSPDRIASNILPGMGFLGAGVIFRDGNVVRGITTAATVWSAAALGMSAGSGHYAMTGLALGMMLVVLEVFERMEQSIFAFERREYSIRLENADDAFLEKRLKTLGLRFQKTRAQFEDGKAEVQFTVAGRPARLDEWHAFLLEAPGVLGFGY